MLKKKTCPKSDRFFLSKELFDKHHWGLDTPRFENFCSLSGPMSDEEFSLLYELTDRFNLLDISNFIIEFLMGYYSCTDDIYLEASQIIITPMKKVDEYGKHLVNSKSGDVVFDEFMAKKHLCEYEEKLIFCKDASEAITSFGDNVLICFVDDFVGSGRTYEETYDTFAHFFSDNGKTLAKNSVFAITAWAMRAGYEVCNAMGLRLFCHRTFNKEISDYPGYTEQEKNVKRGLMQDMEKSYGYKITPHYSLGFSQSEALVSIFEKSPNNTFPIFWKAKNKQNIFPRFK